MARASPLSRAMTRTRTRKREMRFLGRVILLVWGRMKERRREEKGLYKGGGMGIGREMGWRQLQGVGTVKRERERESDF